MSFNFEKFIDNLELGNILKAYHHETSFKDNCQWCGRIRDKALNECICEMNKKARLLARRLLK